MKSKRLRPVHRNIKRLRLALGLDQVQFGRRVGEHKSVICHWEHGRGAPRSTKLPLVARELGVSVDELLGVRAA